MVEWTEIVEILCNLFIWGKEITDTVTSILPTLYLESKIDTIISIISIVLFLFKPKRKRIKTY